MAYKGVIIDTTAYNFRFRPIQVVDLSEIARKVVEGASVNITILSNTTTIKDNLDISKFGEESEDKEVMVRID